MDWRKGQELVVKQSIIHIALVVRDRDEAIAEAFFSFVLRG
jgi:hypothetical protein